MVPDFCNFQGGGGGVIVARADLDEGVRNEIRVGQFLAGFGMRQKENLHFINGPEHDLDGLVAIHGIVEVEELRVNLSEARMSIQVLDAGEDGRRFIVSKTFSAHLCWMVGRVNHPFQKCQNYCPHILEAVPEIF